MNIYNEFDWVDKHLFEGEKVLWQGKPEEGHLFSASDIFFIPFSILWCAFACFWEFSVIVAGAPILFCLWGIPFVLFGLYITVGRFFLKQSSRKQTFYAVTDRKVIRMKKNKTDYLDLRNCGKIHTQVNSDNSGTITFGYDPDELSLQFYKSVRPRFPYQNEDSFRLENIPDVHNVYRIISEQINHLNKQ
jgi:hypothetical protein